MKNRILWLVLAILAVASIAPEVCLAAKRLPVPAAKKIIHTSWPLWDDGIPVVIKDGGEYKLDNGKTGFSITISGLSALAAQVNGNVYLYSPKTNEFEPMKNARKEADKDSIRLVFSDYPEKHPYNFTLPVQNLFPNVWVCFNRIVGNLAEQVYLEVADETGTITIWNDRYQLTYYVNEDESIDALYDPDGRLIEADYTKEANGTWYHCFYRRKMTGYCQYDIVPEEIRISKEEGIYTWKAGVWMNEADEEIQEGDFMEGFVYDPCTISGDAIRMDKKLPDPEDLSWKTQFRERYLQAEIPAEMNAPMPPYVRHEIMEDGAAKLTVDGMANWGVKEEYLGEWTKGRKTEKVEWQMTQESKGDGLLTLIIPADPDLNQDYFYFDEARQKDGGEIVISYSTEDEALSICIEGTDYDFTITDPETMMIFCWSENKPSIHAYYALSTGRLVKYQFTVYLNDSDYIYCTYIWNDPTDTSSQQLDTVDFWKDDRRTGYYWAGGAWRIGDWRIGDIKKIDALPKEIEAALCMPLTIVAAPAE